MNYALTAYAICAAFTAGFLTLSISGIPDGELSFSDKLKSAAWIAVQSVFWPAFVYWILNESYWRD